jgi:hypothetical protein
MNNSTQKMSNPLWEMYLTQPKWGWGLPVSACTPGVVKGLSDVIGCLAEVAKIILEYMKLHPFVHLMVENVKQHLRQLEESLLSQNRLCRDWHERCKSYFFESTERLDRDSFSDLQKVMVYATAGLGKKLEDILARSLVRAFDASMRQCLGNRNLSLAILPASQ